MPAPFPSMQYKRLLLPRHRSTHQLVRRDGTPTPGEFEACILAEASVIVFPLLRLSLPDDQADFFLVEVNPIP